jgi:hypothetical protein
MLMLALCVASYFSAVKGVPQTEVTGPYSSFCSCPEALACKGYLPYGFCLFFWASVRMCGFFLSCASAADLVVYTSKRCSALRPPSFFLLTALQIDDLCPCNTTGGLQPSCGSEQNADTMLVWLLLNSNKGLPGKMLKSRRRLGDLCPKAAPPMTTWSQEKLNSPFQSRSTTSTRADGCAPFCVFDVLWPYICRLLCN